MTILVTGYPGNVASPLVQQLLQAWAEVRLAVRPARARGGDTFPCPAVPFDFTDPATFAAAFAGIDSVFLLRPPQLSNARRDILPAIRAAEAAGVRHIVFLSIPGAERNPLVPHHAIEVALRASTVRCTFVRAAYFMQNLTTTHAPELLRGEIFVPAGGGRTALVDARDVAAVAAAALLDASADDRAWTVTGPAALTYQECAAILTAEWSRPIRYARPGILRYCRVLRRRGVPPPVLAVTVGIYIVARLGRAAGVTADVTIATGRPPRDFRAFARDAASSPVGQGQGETAAVTRTIPPLFLVRLLNPIMRAVLRSPGHAAVDSSLLLLHLTGRRSGHRYDIPVGHHDIGGRLSVLTSSAWRANVRGGADVEVTFRGRREPMHAEIDEDPKRVAAVYRVIIEQLGWKAAQRRLGIAIHVHRTPTQEELEQAVRESGLSIITLANITLIDITLKSKGEPDLGS